MARRLVSLAALLTALMLALAPCTASAQRAAPVAAARRLEVARSSKTPFDDGVLPARYYVRNGALIGGVVGVLVAALIGPDIHAADIPPEIAYGAPIAAGVFGGAFVGWLVHEARAR